MRSLHGMVLKKFIILLDMVYGDEKTNFLTELASVWPCIALQLYNFANKILNPIPLTKVITLKCGELSAQLSGGNN